MGSKLLADLFPEDLGGNKKPPLVLSQIEVFDKHCPYYLSIGMTLEQYWDSDPIYAKYFREADKLKMSRTNYELWLQGFYNYNTLLDVAPVYNPFAPSGTTALPYFDKPIPLTKEEIEKVKKENEIKQFEKNEAMMRRYAADVNNFYERGEEND